MNNPPAIQDETRGRLLHAAGEEFASLGFQASSVRSICAAADANVSAVKYHFGSKKDLYLAVWEVAAAQMVTAEPMPTLEDHPKPRDALRALVAWFMRLVLTESIKHPWAGRLLAHETVDPTPGALEVFVQHCAGPITKEISRMVKAVVGRPVDTKTHDDLVFAVVALCVNPKHSCEILTRLGHPPPTTTEGINRMAGVMAAFALAGLDGFARGDGFAHEGDA